jgi:DNA-binding IclR family transcriptional regulator
MRARARRRGDARGTVDRGGWRLDRHHRRCYRARVNNEMPFQSQKQSRRAGGRRPEPVAALANGIHILRTFTVAEPALGVNEIARRLGMSASTVYRALVTLEDLGLVEQEAATDRYRLASGVIALAGPLLANLDVRDIARPFLEQLARDSRESVNMAIWNRDEAVNIEQVPSPAAIKHLAPLGRRNPPHASAVGKVFLAHLSTEEAAALIARGLPRLTERTITEPARLLADLATTRERGYAVNDEELEPDLVAVAAPVRDRHGQVVAAVSVSAPSFRAPGARVHEFGALVRETAAAIGRRLGHAPPPTP